MSRLGTRPATKGGAPARSLPPTPFIPAGNTGRYQRVLTGRDVRDQGLLGFMGRRGRAFCPGLERGRDERGRTKAPLSTSGHVTTRKNHRRPRAVGTRAMAVGTKPSAEVRSAHARGPSAQETAAGTGSGPTAKSGRRHSAVGTGEGGPSQGLTAVSSARSCAEG